MIKIRKGFTLVELLIVIVIIGILAAAMLLSSGSATDSAEASNIISDLRSLKTAVMMVYADSMDFVNTNGWNAITIGALARYADNPARFEGTTAYALNAPAGGDAVYVTFSFTIDTTRDKAGIRNRLTGRAGSTGLTEGGSETQYNGGAVVGMRAR